MIAASQENTVVGISKVFTSSNYDSSSSDTSLRNIISSPRRKDLSSFWPRVENLLSSPSVSKLLEKSWTYSLSSPDNTSNPQVTHFVAEKKRSLYIACNASDVIGPNPHTSPIIRGLALSTSDATHALRDISRAPSDIAAIAQHRFRIRNLLCSP